MSNMYTGLLLILATAAGCAAAGGNGVDVSHWQGKVDWAQVKAAGVSFASAKATEGGTYTDPTFATNFKGMKAQGIRAGAYHYFKGAVDATSQVAKINSVLKSVAFNDGMDYVAVDVEQGGNEGVSADKMADTLYSVLTQLKKTHSNVMIYTGPSYWENKVNWKKYDFSVYPLWIAHYTSSAPTIPSTWKNKGKTYTWWQHTNKGSVKGIRGNVDLNKEI